MKTLSLTSITTLCVVLVGGALLASCGPVGPTLPTPDAGGTPPPGSVDIHGVVTCPEGLPLENVEVLAVYAAPASEAASAGSWHAFTDALGRYRLSNVTRGSHDVFFSLRGYASEERNVEVGNADVELNVQMRNPNVE